MEKTCVIISNDYIDYDDDDNGDDLMQIRLLERLGIYKLGFIWCDVPTVQTVLNTHKGWLYIVMGQTIHPEWG